MAWLGARAGALNLLLPVGEVAEVLHLAPATPVPLTVAWFRGLSNVRGTLYSVIDLPALLGYAPVQFGAESRLLLLGPTRIRNTALLINRLAGMHPEGSLLQAPEAVPPGADLTAPATAALGAVWQDAQQGLWRELDLAALVALPDFLDVAATPALGAHA